MKTLRFTKPHDLGRLHDELLAAMPSLRQTRTGAEGLNEALPGNMRVEGRGDDIWLIVEDSADKQAIAYVVTAHDAATAGKNPAEARQDRIKVLLATPRSNWATAERVELIELTARYITG